jgi:hypothetical protein
MFPQTRRRFFRLRHATGGVAAAVADRATQGRPNNPRNQDCCSVARLTGGEGGASSAALTMPHARTGAPRGPEPQRSPAGAIDRRSHISRPRTRRHLGGSGWCHRQRVSRQFFEVSIAASSYLGNDQSRSARKGPMEANAPRRKSNAATRSYSRNRSRRASQVAARPGEGPSTEPTAALRPGRGNASSCPISVIA